MPEMRDTDLVTAGYIRLFYSTVNTLRTPWGPTTRQSVPAQPVAMSSPGVTAGPNELRI